METTKSENLRKHILLVDDDPSIIESTRLALELSGYEVDTAPDGELGLVKAERRRPDLLILDMMTPKRSGFLVLETLRQVDDFPTRIIMITANDGSRHRNYAESLGVDAYLLKPFQMDDLLNTVKRLLEDA